VSSTAAAPTTGWTERDDRPEPWYRCHDVTPVAAHPGSLPPRYLAGVDTLVCHTRDISAEGCFPTPPR
jgi:hypothetical protein